MVTKLIKDKYEGNTQYHLQRIANDGKVCHIVYLTFKDQDRKHIAYDLKQRKIQIKLKIDEYNKSLQC